MPKIIQLINEVRRQHGAAVLAVNQSLMDAAQQCSETMHTSHHVKEIFGIDHPVPHIGMGRLCIELNLLRTQVREVELVAAQTFAAPDAAPRPDLIEALNRLSSCVYIIFCRKLSGYYGGEN